jgi:hypothetical protein
MPRVAFDRDGLKIEADLSFDELKELVGINGHKPAEASRQAKESVSPAAKPRKRKRAPASSKQAGDFNEFVRSLSDRAAKFVTILRQHERGIEARDLAPMLGFTDPAQIGGVTGPSISKVAGNQGIKVEHIYKSRIEFADGQRKRMFYPGKLTMGLPGKTVATAAIPGPKAPRKIPAETAKALEFLKANGAATRLEIIKQTGILPGSFGHFVGRRTDLFRLKTDEEYEKYEVIS